MLYRSNTLDHWSHKGSVEGSRVLPQKCQFHPQSTSFGVCSTCVRVLRVLQVLTAASSTAGLLWHLVHVHRVRKKVTRVPFCLPFCKKSMYSVYREYPWCVFQFIASTRWSFFFWLVRFYVHTYIHTYGTLNILASNRVCDQGTTPKWLCGFLVLLMIINGNSWAINFAAWFGSNAGRVDISQVSVSTELCVIINLNVILISSQSCV